MDSENINMKTEISFKVFLFFIQEIIIKIKKEALENIIFIKEECYALNLTLLLLKYLKFNFLMEQFMLANKKMV